MAATLDSTPLPQPDDNRRSILWRSPPGNGDETPAHFRDARRCPRSGIAGIRATGTIDARADDAAAGQRRDPPRTAGHPHDAREDVDAAAGATAAGGADLGDAHE